MGSSVMTATWRRVLGIGLVVAVAIPACAVQGLSFVTDERLTILRPKQNATVSLPLELAWTVEDYDGLFAVFFDRSPMRPNQTLRSLVPSDEPCRSESECPDADWLADRDIYVTDSTRLVVKNLPDRRDNDQSKDRHDLTIVLLSEDGQRIGESVFTKEFVVERNG